MNKRTKRIWFHILMAVCLLGASLIFFLTLWMGNKYDKATIDQFIYQMKTSAAGANRSITNSAIIRVGLFGILLTIVLSLFYMLCKGCFEKFLKNKKLYIKFHATKIPAFIVRRALPIVLAFLLVAMCYFTYKLNVVSYVSAISTDSDFVESHYADPAKVKLTFPEKKRNLIYIFLESLEVTFAEPEAGGPITDNFIPELTQLAEEENNINFSNDDGLGGALSFSGTTWTAAAMVTQTSGVIVQVPLTADNYGGENAYMPGLKSIGEILSEQGYSQTLLLGSNAEFAGRSSYFTEHGNYNIVDTVSLKEEGRLPQDYEAWWGYEDEKLFDYAKEELTKLSSQDEPFNFTMLTADTHFPNGYVCELCDTEEYQAQYPNVLHCSSKQLVKFIEWIKQQPFYENTTIVLSGDHLTMDPDFLQDVNADYQRTIYNCIINSAITTDAEKNRLFGTYDMFPTTLAAMGVEIEGDRLALGTNLFSGKKTLTEEFGFDELDRELQKNSDFYNTRFLEMDAEQTKESGN